MRATVFLVFLILAFCGSSPVVAAPLLQGTRAALVSHQSTKQVGIATDQDISLVKSLRIDSKAEYLIADNTEDEEDSSDTTFRKLRVLLRASLSSYLFTLSRAHNCQAAYRPVSGTVSEKYILQRVLRI